MVLFLIRSCEFSCTFVSLFFEFKSSLKIFSAHSTFPPNFNDPRHPPFHYMWSPVGDIWEKKVFKKNKVKKFKFKQRTFVRSCKIFARSWGRLFPPPAFIVLPSVPVKLSIVLQLVVNDLNQNCQVRAHRVMTVSPYTENSLQISLTYIKTMSAAKPWFNVVIV